jgi:RNA-splicing ligase RtcB
MITVAGKYTTAKIMIDEIEPSCLAQINMFINHSAFTHPVAIMPDTHAGKGSVIGFTMPLSAKVIPNVVGVDIGCGMLSANFGPGLSVSLDKLDAAIRERIPFGMDVHERGVIHMRDEFPWKDVHETAKRFAVGYRARFNQAMGIADYGEKWFLSKCERLGGNCRRFIGSIGTLGGGNHFIETGIDDAGNHWITVHSGSRNLGKRVCEYWQEKARKALDHLVKTTLREEISRIRAESDGPDIEQRIVALREGHGLSGIDTKGLEWLSGAPAHEYLGDMIFAQVYASVNRRTMMKIIAGILGTLPVDTIETVHNYIDFDDFIIRKGAIRSYEHERMIIPFNMRDGLLICTGKSNREWNFSAPHGAGRLMSRTEARKTLSVETFAAQMTGIFSTSVGRSTLDECPDAYKPPAQIEAAIAPTADIVARVKPLHNMKDCGGGPGD